MKDVKRKVGEVYTRNGHQYEVKICPKCRKKKGISVASRIVICESCKRRLEKGTELGRELNDVYRAFHGEPHKKREVKTLLRL